MKSLPYSLLLAAFCCQLPWKAFAENPAPNQPNIVIILADDMGYGDLKAYNPDCKISTPHLDALSAAGMTFTDAHSGGSTCKPSRYALLTGQFAVRRDSMNDDQPIIPEGRSTIATMLRDSGYHTAMVGKWHLGFDRTLDAKEGKGKAFDYDQPINGGPVDRGFDSFFGMHASLDIQPYFYMRDRAPTMAPTDTADANDSVGGEEDWNHIQGAFWRAGDIAPDFVFEEVTPRFADEASKVIESHDGKKPLFLYLALPSPHTPWLPTKEFIGKSGAGMYGDFVMQVDAVVGQVVESLDEAGMRENTVILFSSDNGPVWYEKDVDRFDHRSVGPLRGCKASVWEGGHRVPFIVRWPSQVQAGETSDHLLAFADVYATLAEASGAADIGDDAAEDSVSFLSALVAPDSANQSRPPILHGERTIRDGNWKLIATKGSRGFNAEKGVQYGIELYNLQKDLSEENNLADSMPEKVERLRDKIQVVLGEKNQ
ncbi:MAG: arylsulfatase [Verrucomicrobiota bacterium]